MNFMWKCNTLAIILRFLIRETAGSFWVLLEGGKVLLLEVNHCEKQLLVQTQKSPCHFKCCRMSQLATCFYSLGLPIDPGSMSARPWHMYCVSLGILHDMEPTAGSTDLRAKSSLGRPFLTQNPRETPVLEISPKMLKYNVSSP